MGDVFYVHGYTWCHYVMLFTLNIVFDKCDLYHIKISETMVFHASFLVSLESYQWIGVHWLGLNLFGAIMWNLLLLNHFFWRKLNKIKTKNYIEIWGCPWCHWKTFNKSNLIKFISWFWKLKCGRYWFLIGFGSKRHITSQCVYFAFKTFVLLGVIFSQKTCFPKKEFSNEMFWNFLYILFIVAPICNFLLQSDLEKYKFLKVRKFC